MEEYIFSPSNRGSDHRDIATDHLRREAGRRAANRCGRQILCGWAAAVVGDIHSLTCIHED